MSDLEPRELTCEEENILLKEEKRELQEALRKEIEFKTATELPRTQVLDIWIPAIEAIKLFVPLNQARRQAIDHNDPWHRLIFKIAEDGHVQDAKLENQEQEG